MQQQDIPPEGSFDEIWADVQPIPQNDGPNPVVKIAYSKQCNDNLLSICDFFLLAPI